MNDTLNIVIDSLASSSEINDLINKTNMGYDLLIGIIASLIVWILSLIYTWYKSKKSAKKKFNKDLKMFLLEIKVLQDKEEISKEASRKIMIAVSNSFGEDFKEDSKPKHIIKEGDDCWFCELPYKKSGNNCEDCKFNCATWEGNLNPNLAKKN
jgi:hypothetical protein